MVGWEERGRCVRRCGARARMRLQPLHVGRAATAPARFLELTPTLEPLEPLLSFMARLPPSRQRAAYARALRPSPSADECAVEVQGGAWRDS